MKLFQDGVVRDAVSRGTINKKMNKNQMLNVVFASLLNAAAAVIKFGFPDINANSLGVIQIYGLTANLDTFIDRSST